eukprot:Gb_30967 [translate_table: standard]
MSLQRRGCWKLAGEDGWFVLCAFCSLLRVSAPRLKICLYCFLTSCNSKQRVLQSAVFNREICSVNIALRAIIERDLQTTEIDRHRDGRYRSNSALHPVIIRRSAQTESSDM